MFTPELLSQEVVNLHRERERDRERDRERERRERIKREFREKDRAALLSPLQESTPTFGNLKRPLFSQIPF